MYLSHEWEEVAVVEMVVGQRQRLFVVVVQFFYLLLDQPSSSPLMSSSRLASHFPLTIRRRVLGVINFFIIIVVRPV